MEFAPVNTTGNYRSLKFLKYLNDYGISSAVITFPEQEAALYFERSIDTNLLRDLPADIEIFRIHCDQPNVYRNKFQSAIQKYFRIEDAFAKNWRPYLFRELDAIITRVKPNFIYTSLPPFSSGKLTLEISKKYNLPLIVDMRDLWALWGLGSFASRLHFQKVVNRERKIFKQASAVISVTTQTVKLFKDLHSTISKDKFHYISNGFDNENNIDSSFSFPGAKKKIVIGYVGSFYYVPQRNENILMPWWKKKMHRKLQYTPIKENWLYRSPYFFLKTISLILEKQPSLQEVIQIEFVGEKAEWLNKMVAEMGLQKNVRNHGYLPQQAVKNLQQDFDLILATSEKVINGKHYCLPSKLFDTIGINKPILGFVTEGVQKEFIQQSGLGIVFDPDDIDLAADNLIKLLTEGKQFTVDINYLQEFNRKNLARQLSEVLKNVVVSA